MLDPYHIHDPENPSISKSELDLINNSPALYHRRVVQGHRRPDSPALIFGSAFHAAVLEPLEFDDRYAVVPEELAGLNKNTKAYKQGLAEFKEEQVDSEGNPKDILSVTDYADIVGMSESVMAHPLAVDLLSKVTHTEEAFYWQDERLGVRCRCKPDLITSDGIVADLKSTRDRLDDWHAQSAVKWRYDVQQVHYMAGLLANGLDVHDFQFIVVEKVHPYSVAVMGLEPSDIEQAEQEWRMDLATYAACLKSGKWPAAYATQTEVVRRFLPTWRRNRY